MKSVVAFLVVFVAMGITFGLVRFMANLVIIAAGVAAFWFVHSGIGEGDFVTWSDVLFASAIAGAVVGLVCTPLLPLSDWGKKKEIEKIKTPERKRGESD
jgi:hypothetical protein